MNSKVFSLLNLNLRHARCLTLTCAVWLVQVAAALYQQYFGVPEPPLFGQLLVLFILVCACSLILSPWLFFSSCFATFEALMFVFAIFHGLWDNATANFFVCIFKRWLLSFFQMAPPWNYFLKIFFFFCFATVGARRFPVTEVYADDLAVSSTKAPKPPSVNTELKLPPNLAATAADVVLKTKSGAQRSPQVKI